MRYTTLFFDLDDTLYPPSSGVWDAIGVRIDQYMHERVGISMKDVPDLREQLFRTYGTTLRGLTLLYGIDAHDYLAYVHDIPLTSHLTPDSRLSPLLRRYMQRKVIFTNADRAHAQRVLRVLDLEGVFDQIIDILDVAPYCKPMPEAFALALEAVKITNPEECILLDDSPTNLRAARAAGFFTIRVGVNSPDGCCHAAVASLHDIPSILDPLLMTSGVA
jgi:putative hydrolase of the HAD superfamily